MGKTTMRDVANRLGVSINAVSLALGNKSGVSESTRDRMIRTAYEMGYFEGKASILKKVKLRNICIVVKNKALTDVHFHNLVFRAMQAEVKRQGYDTIIEFSEDLSELPSCIQEYRVSGVAVVGTFSDEGLARIQATHIPMVVVNHESYALSIDSVVNKNYQGAYLAFMHLYQRGHRRIGFVGYVEGSSSLRLRKAGFMQAAIDHHMYGEDISGGFAEMSFETDLTPFYVVHNIAEIAAHLMNKFGSVEKLPTAFFCHNDATAIAMIQAVNLLQLEVPRDISMVSFDNIELASGFTPALTTISVPIKSMGIRAIERLVRRIENRNLPCDTLLLEMELLQRDSVRDLNVPDGAERSRED